MISKGPGKVGIAAAEIPGFPSYSALSTELLQKSAQERGFFLNKPR